MNITAAHVLARDLMDLHGLEHVPFEFDRGKDRMGGTHYGWAGDGPASLHGVVKKITISKFYAELNPEYVIKETVLHEIAHALVWISSNGAIRGHGVEWKRQARKLGIEGNRCTEPVAEPEGAWRPYCPKCDKVLNTHFHRAPLLPRSCNLCVPGKFSPNHILQWMKHGRIVEVSNMPVKYQRLMVRYQ